MMAHPALLAHRAQFQKRVVELAPGVWTAVGHAASNAHMIEGDASVTIVDTTESTGAAENIRAAFRELSDKPVARIIYTHSHRDHISGATVFAEGRDIPIVASATFASDLIGRDPDAIGPDAALARRTQAQFGIGLTPEERVSLGCGPGDRPMAGLGAGFIPPSEPVHADCDIDLDGVEARLIHALGETADHLMVWLPGPKVLLSGDNWYHAFPNLYAIRGTAYRDFGTWAESLAMMVALAPEVLSPGHTQPVFGAEAIRDRLETTRAAILHVIAHTAAGMNAGQSLDDIAATIRLPDDIADRPWLGEYYGKLAWSVRAYATGMLGWYDGNPTHLGTLPSADRAAHLAELTGGVTALMHAARATDDLQWRLELCDHRIALGEPAEALKAEALEAMAEAEINATARNTYLWEAKRLRGREP